LGTGAFGHVYLGIELQTNQLYAIKEYLVTGYSGQKLLENESLVLSRLYHPNLPLFKEAFADRGRYYVVLNYIEGNDLTDYVRIVRQRNEVIPIARILTWILSVCDAVSFLHSQQPVFIHRDIKPDNIRITPNGTAMLLDLGNAKAVADGARTLFFIRHQGTPGYAPPEQYPGGSGTDVRSDVYALGGTLFFALTAHEPPSVSARSQSLEQGQPDLPSLQELLAKNPPEESADVHTTRQFRLGVSRPSKPRPRHSRHLDQLGQLPSELLDQLNRIIKRAMALRPKERYQSANEFSHDLSIVLASLPSFMKPSSTEPKRSVEQLSSLPTQPLFSETIYTAKIESDQAPGDKLIFQPSSQPAAFLRCPRCNFELVPQIDSCPNCGLALFGLIGAYQLATSSKLNTNIQQKDKIPVLSLFAHTRVLLEDDDRALVGKIYTVQAMIAQSNFKAFQEKIFKSSMPTIDDPISFDILCHTSENIRLTTEWHKRLDYDPLNPEPQFVTFTFQAVSPRFSYLAIDFYNERRWLRTAQHKFDSVKQSEFFPFEIEV